VEEASIKNNINVLVLLLLASNSVCFGILTWGRTGWVGDDVEGWSGDGLSASANYRPYHMQQLAIILIHTEDNHQDRITEGQCDLDYYRPTNLVALTVQTTRPQSSTSQSLYIPIWLSGHGS
jgi:hypothetical protein